MRRQGRSDIYLFEFEAFFGQNRNAWRRFPAGMLGVFQSELKCLAACSSFSSRCYVARSEIPGDGF